MAQEPLTIEPVESRKDLDRFIRVPWHLHRADPNWVPPLLMERRDFLNRRKNPFFDTADVKLWLARRGSEDVGRISAQVNHVHLERYRDATGHFGMIESEDRAETFQALLKTAESWLESQGLERAVGPFSLSINQESGLLVEGFDTPPSLMMGHAPPYYAARLEEQGYAKIKDLICYHFDMARALPASVAPLMRKVAKSSTLTIRQIDRRRYDEELACVMDIFHDAWSDNWGFLPLSPAEVRHLGKEMKPLLRPESVAIAELDGAPAAMAVVLPNLNEVIADLDGKLLPFGWIKLLWRLKIKTPLTGRLLLMGVRREFHNTTRGAAMAYGVIDRIRANHEKLGLTGGELSWILEDNLAMRRIIEHWGATAYKKYRLYERSLR